MSRIEVDHNGITINYSENEDVWRCASFEVDGKTLSAVKAKVNKLMADARRIADPTRVFTVESWSLRASDQGILSLVDEDGKHVWITTTKMGWWNGQKREEKARSKHKLESVIIDTPEARATLEDARKKISSLNEQVNAEKSRVDALPRITSDMLANLTKGGKE